MLQDVAPQAAETAHLALLDTVITIALCCQHLTSSLPWGRLEGTEVMARQPADPVSTGPMQTEGSSGPQGILGTKTLHSRQMEGLTKTGELCFLSQGAGEEEQGLSRR